MPCLAGSELMCSKSPDERSMFVPVLHGACRLRRQGTGDRGQETADRRQETGRGAPCSVPRQIERRLVRVPFEANRQLAARAGRKLNGKMLAADRCLRASAV